MAREGIVSVTFDGVLHAHIKEMLNDLQRLARLWSSPLRHDLLVTRLSWIVAAAASRTRLARCYRMLAH